ncbi:uncharacterized protein LOC122010554 [Zingiber officinale]|uniref:Uncharacterized protein n=1 Tax=Zingiber officinale TaxID=94328 RepID=A0A8J5FTC6_ZINOF|nr:uncharacterized protein LOC122010554 [Zingiber officinale]KAG6485261.1 hypothetical protein ZIOFF_053795 [Zingiber officinale]
MKAAHRLLQGSSSSSEGETSEEEAVAEMEHRPPSWLDDSLPVGNGGNACKKRLLSKQLSMRETRMEAKWERRRRQILKRRKSSEAAAGETETAPAEERRPTRSLTDEDMDELRGSIDLGFGFREEDGGHDLCGTLPALNLYFAVNRQLSDPKLPGSGSPMVGSASSRQGGLPSPRSPAKEQGAPPDSWKICDPGDNPEHVKTRLRHWAQAVAFSLRLSF